MIVEQNYPRGVHGSTCACAYACAHTHCSCTACALQVFLENQADSLGLSKAQILLVVLYTVVMLAMVMTFILFAIGAWQNEGSFNAVVQSALVSGVGKVSKASKVSVGREVSHAMSRTLHNSAMLAHPDAKAAQCTVVHDMASKKWR